MEEMIPKTRKNSLQVEEAWVIELIIGGGWEDFEDGRGMFLLSGTFFPILEGFIAYVHFPSPGIGPIHLNEIECTGNEKSIIDCKFNAESQGCNHEEDAGVRCNIPAMGFQKRVRSLDSQRELCYIVVTEAPENVDQMASG